MAALSPEIGSDKAARRETDATAGHPHGYPELIPGKYSSAFNLPMWAELIASSSVFRPLNFLFEWYVHGKCIGTNI